jgi:hypothetical protein
MDRLGEHVDGLDLADLIPPLGKVGQIPGKGRGVEIQSFDTF